MAWAFGYDGQEGRAGPGPTAPQLVAHQWNSPVSEHESGLRSAQGTPGDPSSTPVTRLQPQRDLPARSSLSPGSRASGEAHTACLRPAGLFLSWGHCGSVRSHCQVRVLFQMTPFLLCAPGTEGERELSGVSRENSSPIPMKITPNSPISESHHAGVRIST